MTRRWVIAALLALLSLAGAVIAMRFLRSKPAHGATDTKPAPLAAAPIHEAILTCSVGAQHTIPVTPLVEGEVQELLAETGQDVYEGQVLARIGNRGLAASTAAANRALADAKEKQSAIESSIIATRLEVSRAQAAASRARDEANRAEKTFERQRMLEQAGATPRLTFEKAQRDYEATRKAAEALDELERQAGNRVNSLNDELTVVKRGIDQKQRDLDQAQQNLAAAEVHAPSNGVVVARGAQTGDHVGPGSGRALFQIAADLNSLAAICETAPGTAANIRPGFAALVTLPDLQITPITATVRESRGTQVIAEFTSANPAIRPGMPCSARIRLQ